MSSVSKTFQELITFSRSTNGTYVNSAGYIANTPVANYLTYSNQPENAAWTKSNSFVQQNLLTYSEQFDSSGPWYNSIAGTGVNSTVTANQSTAPNGTLTADRIQFNLGGGTTTGDFTRRIQSYVTAAVTHTYSIYLRSYDGVSTYNMHLVGPTGGTTNIVVTGSWQRFEVTATGTGASVAYALGLRGGQTPANSNTADVLAWGAQLVQGSVPGDYRATTSAALPVLYPDYTGALRARKLCENDAVTQAHRIQQVVNLSGTSVTLSQRLKAGERTWAYLRIDDAVSTKFAYFNLSAGTVGFATAPLTSTITSVGGGWYVCTATFASPSATASGTYVVGAATADGVNAYTGNGSSGIYVADAQLEPGTSVGPYYDTSATLTYIPRLDYDPVTLLPRGLLVEESRANYITRSSDFSNSAWNNASPNIPTVTTDAILSPDGTVNADLLTASTGGVACQTRQVGATGTTGNFTASVFLKVGSTTRNRIILTDHTSVFTVVGDFQVAWTAGVASVFSTTSGTASIVAAGNGWYRCIVTASTASANALMGIAIFPDPVAGTGSVYVYGAQVEAGAFATSYIPTTTSQLTRAADGASVNTLSPWYNSVAGTLYVEYDVPVVAGAMPIRALAAFSDGTTSNRIYQYLSNTSVPNLLVTDAGVAQVSIGNSAISANVTVKTAGTFTENDFAVVTNGGTVATDLAGTIPTAITRLELGGFTITGAYLSGHVRRITYYPQRLTNTQLQSITA